MNELTVSVEGLEKERDFYFSKLRDIEVLCHGGEEGGAGPPPVIKQILDILYATEVLTAFSLIIVVVVFLEKYV